MGSLHTKPYYWVRLASKDLDGFYRARDVMKNEILAQGLSVLEQPVESGSYRWSFVGRSGDEILEQLEKNAKPMISKPNRTLAYLCSGIGDHYLNMGRDLYNQNSVYRNAFNLCSQHFHARSGFSLIDILFPEGPEEVSQKSDQGTRFDLRMMLQRRLGHADPHTARLNQPVYTHPTLFAVEYAMSQLLASFGLQPSAFAGYSMGEYVAATLAGVFSLEDALDLVSKRAELIAAMPVGAMVALPLTESELKPLMSHDLEIAILSGPLHSVVAGSEDAVMDFERQLTVRHQVFRRLANSRAIHTSQMKSLRQELVGMLNKIPRKPPTIPYLSNVTGDWIKPEQATDPEYWADHTCQTVRFGECLGKLLSLPGVTLVELGPGKSLCSFAYQHEAFHRAIDPVLVSSIRGAGEMVNDNFFFAEMLAKIWQAGWDIDE